MSLRDEILVIQQRHAEQCDRVVQAAIHAGMPLGYGACGNGGIPTFPAIVDRCVQAMDEFTKQKARAERLEALLQDIVSAYKNRFDVPGRGLVGPIDTEINAAVKTLGEK